MTDDTDRPRSAFLSHLAFAIVLAIVIARCLMLESIRDLGSDPNAPPAPGAATSIVLDWLSFVPALLLLARRLIDRDFTLRFNLAHALLSLLALWTLASIFWGDDRFLALISSTRIAAGAAIFWTMSQLATRSAHLRVVVGVFVGLLLVNVVQGALYQNVELADLRHYYEQNKDQILAQHGWRAGDYVAERFEMKLLAGEMLNFSISANVLGSLVVTAALAAYGAARQRLNHRDDLGFAGALLLAALGSLYVLAHTGSKASWAALALGIVLIEAWGLTRRLVARRRAITFAACIGAIAIGVVGLIAFGIAHGGLPSDSLNFRWRYWVGSWPLVREHSLLGVGWGNFADFYLAHRVPAAAEEIQDPHSFPVRWLVELGIVGLTLGIGWLLAWSWRATVAVPSPGTPGEGEGEGESVRTSRKKTLTPAHSQNTRREDQMRISRVLLALLLALALTVACTIDFGGDGSYATLELMRRSMFIGLIALSVGLVCLGKRQSPGEAFFVDERPAPWLAAGLFIGVLLLLLQSTIDMTLFQPGPWVLTVMAMGALMGVAQLRAEERMAVSAAATVPPVPHRLHEVTPSTVGKAGGWRATSTVFLLSCVVWLVGGGLFVLPTVLAEAQVSDGDSLLPRQPHSAYFDYQKAYGFAPVSNFDYASRAANAAARDASGLDVRKPLDIAIAAAPHHALSWLTRSRYLSSQKDVSAADAQQAIDDFGHAITLNPNDVDLRLEYADLLERFGHRAEAAEQLEIALKLDDQLDPAEPERLELRSPGKAAQVRERAAKLRGG